MSVNTKMKPPETRNIKALQAGLESCQNAHNAATKP